MTRLDSVGVKRLWIWNTRGKANFYTWHPYRQIVSIPHRYGTLTAVMIECGFGIEYQSLIGMEHIHDEKTMV